MKIRFKGQAKLFMKNLKRTNPGYYRVLKSYFKDQRKKLEKEFEHDLKKQRKKLEDEFEDDLKKQRRKLRDEFEDDLKKQRRKLIKEFKKSLRKQTDKLEDIMESQIEDGLEDELYSERFANLLRSVLRGEELGNNFREIAEQFLNDDAEVVTNAGTISGVVIEVGDNYLILQETDSTIIIVPFENLISIRPQ